MEHSEKLIWIYIVCGFVGVFAVLFHDDEDTGCFPENVSIVEGEIIAFEPYFEHIHRKPFASHHATSSPLRKEGIQVSIAYTNELGDQETLNEEWMMPCVDFFETGDLVHLIWSKSNPHPNSAVTGLHRLRRSLRVDVERKSPASDADLWEQRHNEISGLLKKHEKMSRLLDLYTADFGDDSRPEWAWDDVRAKWEQDSEFGDYHRRMTGTKKKLRMETTETPNRILTEVSARHNESYEVSETPAVAESIPSSSSVDVNDK